MTKDYEKPTLVDLNEASCSVYGNGMCDTGSGATTCKTGNMASGYCCEGTGASEYCD